MLTKESENRINLEDLAMDKWINKDENDLYAELFKNLN
jgi:hypothetical protein